MFRESLCLIIIVALMVGAVHCRPKRQRGNGREQSQNRVQNGTDVGEQTQTPTGSATDTTSGPQQQQQRQQQQQEQQQQEQQRQEDKALAQRNKRRRLCMLLGWQYRAAGCPVWRRRPSPGNRALCRALRRVMAQLPGRCVPTGPRTTTTKCTTPQPTSPESTTTPGSTTTTPESTTTTPESTTTTPESTTTTSEPTTSQETTTEATTEQTTSATTSEQTTTAEETTSQAGPTCESLGYQCRVSSICIVDQEVPNASLTCPTGTGCCIPLP